MIDEQLMLYVKFGRWEETFRVHDLHSLGVAGWLKPIRELITPIDFRTPSIVDRVAGYMASEGFSEHGDLLKKAIAVFVSEATIFGERALTETKDFNALRIGLMPRTALRRELDRVYGIMYYAAEMSAYFQDNEGDFNRAVKALAHIADVELMEFNSVMKKRSVIRRPDLTKKLKCSSSMLNKRPDFPKPISEIQKPQVFYVDEVNEYLKSRGEPELDVE